MKHSIVPNSAAVSKPAIPNSNKPSQAKYLRLILSLFAIALLAACNQSKPTTPSAPEGDSNRVTFDLAVKDKDGFETLGVTQGNGITVTFEKTADWDAGSGKRGFTANITLLNQTNKPINDWDLGFAFPYAIDQAWGAEVSTTSAAASLINPDTVAGFKLVPASWNAKLAHNQSRSFGFKGSYTGAFVEPSAYVLSGVPIGEQGPVVPPVVACTLETRFQVNSSWENGGGTKGFVAELYLTNVGSQPVDWSLDFDFDNVSIQNMWNADFVQDEASFAVTPASWNTRLEPGATTQFGFQGVYEGNLGEPQNIVCNKGEEPTDPDPTDPDPTDPETPVDVTPPPAPWQELTLGDGVGSADYDSDTQSFTLATTPNEGEVSHFVYQTLNQDATLTARVNLADTSDASAKAGLMLRASTEADSSYAFLSLSSGGVVLEYTDELGNIQRVEGGDTNDTAKYLRLERKEDSIYAYESDDGVNFALMTTVALSLADPFGAGIALNSTQLSGPGLFEQVKFFFTPNEVQDTIGTEGGGITLQNGSAVGIQPDALKTDTPVRFSVERNPSESYPQALEGYFPGNPDLITPIGDPVTLSLSKTAINFDQRILFAFILSTPQADLNCSGANEGCGVEIRIKLQDGSYGYYLDQFRDPDRGFFITNETLRSIQDELPEKLEIQLRPIDWSSWVTNEGASVQQGVIQTQAIGEFEETSGLYRLGSNYSHDSFATSCTFPQTMPIAEATIADVPKDKTPLILIHGYQAAGNTITNGIISSKKNFNVPLCGWKDVIELFANEENYSEDKFNFYNLPQNILREEYELFTFGYDSRNSFGDNAEALLAEKLKIFSGRDIVIAAYSMGGVLAKDYIQTEATAANVNVERLISFGTPFMGTPMILCTEEAGVSCVNANVNPYLPRVLTGFTGATDRFLPLLPTIISYQGTRDASYQLPISYEIVSATRNGPVILESGTTRPNPYLERLNGWESSCNTESVCVSSPSTTTSEIAKFNTITTSITGTSSSSIKAGSFLVPIQESDELTTLQSACVSNLADDCSTSPFDTVIVIPELNHINVNAAPVLSVFARELLSIKDKLFDIDDGTSDGNQRSYIGNTESPCCSGLSNLDTQGDGILDVALQEKKPLMLTKGEYGEWAYTRPDIFYRLGEQAGDDRIDMSDFRRWRDWLLFTNGKSFNLSGSVLESGALHPKIIVNGWESITDTNYKPPYFPFGWDFNGDGDISLEKRIPVGGLDAYGYPSLHGTPNLTDLEVFYQSLVEDEMLWKDPNYLFDDINIEFLTQYANSGDLEVWPRQFLNRDDIERVTSCVRLTSATQGDCFEDERTHSDDSQDHDIDYYRQVYTLPLNDAGYTVEVKGFDGDGRILYFAQREVTLELGSDDFWDPTPFRFDMDDDTPHGNQFTYITQSSGAGASTVDGVASGLKDGDRVLYSDFSDAGATDFTNTDAAEDGHIGDGEFVANEAGEPVYQQKVDLADFRRLRDALLASEPGLELASNGSDGHVKKQIGEGSQALELLDYNGDGEISINKVAPVPAMTDIIERDALRFVFEPVGTRVRIASSSQIDRDENDVPLMSDLDVFFHALKSDADSGAFTVAGTPLWQDDSSLLNINSSRPLHLFLSSGDIEVWPNMLFTAPEFNVTSVTSSVEGVEGASFTHTTGEDEERYVYTLPVREEPYKVTAVASGPGGEVLRREAMVKVALGGSVLWDPTPLVVDLDDGTKDGNQSKLITSKTASGDGDEDGVADDLGESLLEFGNDFSGVDADTDGFYGDGEMRVTKDGMLQAPAGGASVDMRDFRRMRDQLLGLPGEKISTQEGSLGLLLGDLNRDGEVSKDKRQVVFEFDDTAVSQAGGAAPNTGEPYKVPELTDFEVFYNALLRGDTAWSDPDVGIGELPDLLDSGDVEIWPRGCLALSRAARVESSINGKVFTHSGADDREMGSVFYSLPQGSYEASVKVYSDEGTVIAQATQPLSVSPGSDELWDPFCADIRFFYDDEPLQNHILSPADAVEVAVAGEDPAVCPLAEGSVRIEVEAVGLTDATFTSLTQQNIGESLSSDTKREQMGTTTTITYTEEVKDIPRGEFTLKAEAKGGGSADEPVKGETKAEVGETDCALTLSTSGTPEIETITCEDSYIAPGSGTVSASVLRAKDKDGQDLVASYDNIKGLPGLVGSWQTTETYYTYSGSASDLSANKYPVTLTVTYTDGTNTEKTDTLAVEFEPGQTPNCTPPPECEEECSETDGTDGGATGTTTGGAGGGVGPGPERRPNDPVKMTKYKPKTRPTPSSYSSGWGCFGRGCLYGGGGGWGGWGWGGGGWGLGPLPIAKTFGDPHISTADGVAYSTMKLGEFTYLYPLLPGGVEAQARQTTIPNFADWASFNTAFAIRVDETVFEVRLPESGKFGDDLVLLIDGEISILPLGRYTIGDAFIQIDDGNELTLYYQEPNIEQGIYNSTATRIRVGAMTENSLVRPDPDKDVLSLEMSVDTPPVGRYSGLLGTIDGNAENEAMLKDGTFPEDWDGFIEGYRVLDRAESLFTYAPGEGPETYNLPQTAEMPTREELLGQTGGVDYFALAESLLRDTCNANVEAIDETFIRFAAIELAAGRPQENMVDAGICKDEHVDGAGEPELKLMGLRLDGQLTLAGQSDVTIAGASVTVYSPTLGRAICETATFAEGRYTCGGSFFPPAGSSVQLDYRITGRGAPISFTTNVATPADGQWGEHAQDFALDLERVLHLSGRITDQTGSGVDKAQIRISGPAIYQTFADAQGYYDVYLPLPDGVTLGVLTIEATEEDHTGYGKRQENLVLNQEGVLDLERNLEIDTTEEPPVVDTTSERTIVFTGKLLNSYNPAFAVAGAQVRIEAPELSEACITTSSATGSYSCQAVTESEEPFDVTLRTSGYGPSITRTFSVSEDELPAAGATDRKDLGDLELTPSTLTLSGKVVAAGEIEIDATVKATLSRDDLDPIEVSAETTPDGTYALYASLPDGLIGELNVDFTSSLSTPFGNVDTSAQSVVNVASGLQSSSLDIVYQTRRLVFTGKVLNALVPGFGVEGATYSVTRTDTNQILCTGTSGKLGAYSCKYEVLSAQPFPVRIAVTGKGSFTTNIQVDPSEASLDGYYPIVTSLSVSPNTLRLTGSVTDNTGVPLENVSLRLSGAGQLREIRTDASGRYLAVIGLPDTTTSGDLDIDLEHTSAFGEVKKRVSQSFSASGLSDINADYQLDVITGAYDRISIEGNLANLTAPFDAASEGLSVRVEGVGTSGVGLICETVTREGGTFKCGKRNPIAIPRVGSLEASYTVLADGQQIAPAEIQTYVITPSSDLVNELYPELQISPAMLKLSGRAVDLAGQPVAGATFKVGSPVRRDVNTDTQGDYAVYLPLPLNAATGTFSYTLEQASVATDVQTLSYDLVGSSYAERELGVSELPFNLFGRSLALTGQARPASAPEVALGETVMRVYSQDEGLLCETVLEANGSYLCEGFTTNPNAFAYSYELNGSWGEATYQASAPAGLFGDTIATARDFDLDVSVLELSGLITNESSAPLVDVQLTLSGDLNASFKTDATGRYLYRALMPAGANEAALELRATLTDKGLSEVRPLSVSLTNAALTPVVTDLIFANRDLTLSGTLRNRFAPALSVAQTAISIDLAGSTICDVVTSDTGTFSCPALTLSGSGALELSYTATGEWGSNSGIATVLADAIPAAGASGTTTLDLFAEPTTLSLSGRVTDDAQTPLEGAKLNVSGVASANVTIDAIGQFDLAFIVPADAPADFVYTVSYGSAGLTSVVAKRVEIVANTLNTLTEDVIFAERALAIRGSVVNNYAPQMSLANVGLKVERAGQTVCETMTDRDGTFTCPDMRNSLTEPFSFTYQVTGVWGSEQQTASVAEEDLAALGERASYTLALGTNPTTLKLSGYARDDDGLGIAGVSVTAKDGTFLTNSDGYYEGYITFTQAIANLTLEVSATDGVNTRSASQLINLIAGQLSEVNTDFTLAKREPGEARWSAGSRVFDLAHAAGVTYVALEDDVAAFSAEGTELWRFSSRDTRGLVITEEGHILVGAYRKVHALDASGAELWSADLNGTPSFLALGYDATLYVSVNSTITAFDASGIQKWQVNTGSTIESLAVGTDNTLYFGTYSGLQALNPDGSSKWTQSLNGTVFSLAIAADGTIYAGSNNLTALNSEGDQIWQEYIGGSSYLGSIILGSDKIYIGSQYGVDAYSKEGGLLWSADSSRAVQGLALGSNDTLYATTSRDLTAYGNDSSLLWTLDVESSYGSLSLIDGTLLFGAERLYAVNATSGLAASDWPQTGRNPSKRSAADFDGVERRIVSVSGKVSNANEPGSTLSGVSVEVRTSANTLLCSAKSDADGVFACASQVETKAALDLMLTARSLSGASISATSRADAGSANSVTEVTVDAAIPLSTILFTGTVTKDGELASGVDVELTSFDEGYAKVSTDAEGRFSMYVSSEYSFSNESATDIPFEFTADDGVNSTSANVTVNVAPGVLTQQVVDLDIKAAGLGSAVWSADLAGSTARVTAVADDGSIYVSAGNRVFKFSPDGTELWQFSTYRSASALAIASDGTLYVGAGYYSYALNPDGTQKWRVRQNIYDFALTDNLIVARDSYNLIALDTDGTEVWRSEKLNSLRGVAIGPDKSVLYWSYNSLGSYNLDGTPRFSLVDDVDHLVVASDALYTAGYDAFTKRDLDGREVWRQEVDQVYGIYALVQAADGTLYAGTNTGIVSLNSAGEVLWKNTDITRIADLLLGDDGTIYASKYGELFALSSSGETLWSFTGDAIYSLGATSGVIYAGGRQLYAVRASLTGLPTSGWPKEDRDARNSAQADFDGIARRSITFSGKVANLNTGLALGNYRVSVTDAGGETLCTATTDASGVYTCGARTTQTATFNASFSVEGDKGSLTGVILPVASDTISVQQDLNVPITTLVLRGAVTDGSAGLADVSVNISGDVYASIKTDSEGRFEYVSTLYPDTTKVNVTLTADNGLNTQMGTLTLLLTSGGRTEATRDFVLRSDLPGTARWSAPSSVRVQAMHNGVIYTGSQGYSSYLRAYDLIGTETWSFYSGYYNNVRAISVTDSHVFMGNERNLYKFNPDGSQVWTYLTSDYVNSILPTNDGGVYLGTDNVQRLDTNGQLLWSFHTGSAVNTLVLAADGTLYAGTSNGLYALNSSGTQRWLKSVGSVSSLAITPDGDVAAGVRYAVSAFTASGEPAWELDVNGYSVSSIIYGADGKLFIGSNGVEAFSATRTPLWSAGTGTVKTLLSADDGSVMAATTQGAYAFAAGGSQLWRFGTQYSSTASLENGTLYLGADKLYAVNVSATKLADSVWPTPFKDNANTRQVKGDGLPRRVLMFDGTLTHPHRPDFALTDHEVSVLNATGKLLCSATTDATGFYSCSTPSTELSGFVALLEVSGEIATLKASVNVPAGTAESVIRTTTNLSPDLSTLLIKGQVTDPEGTGLANMSVSGFIGDEVVRDCEGEFCFDVSDAQVSTGLDGAFELYLDFPSNVAASDITLLMEDDLNIDVATFNQTLVPGGLTERTEVFIFDNTQPGSIRWIKSNYFAPLPALSPTGNVLTGDGTVVSYDRDGAELWSQFTPSDADIVIAPDGTSFHSSPPAIFPGLPLTITALNQDGTLKWTAENAYFELAAVTLTGNLIATQGTLVTAYSESGAALWTSTLEAPATSLVLTREGVLYAATLSGLESIDTNGASVFKINDVEPESLAVMSNGSIAFSDSDQVRVVAPDGTETYSIAVPNVNALVVGESDTLYVGTGDSGVLVYANGVEVKRITSDSVTTLALGDDGIIYAGMPETISAFDQAGTELWTLDSQFSYFDAFMIDKGTLYAVDSYDVFAINASSQALAATSWPVAGGNNQNSFRAR